jgi:hypothetical protein
LFDIIQKYRLSGRKVLLASKRMNPAAQALMAALAPTSGEGGKAPASQAPAAGEPRSPAAEGLKLLRAFLNIRDATLRRSVVHLVELLAGTPAKR